MSVAFLKSLNEDEMSYELKEFNTIGSSAEVSLLIRKQGVEERQARIEKTDSGFVIRDLRTAGGTFVNDTRIMEAALADGDIVRFGCDQIKSEFVFVVPMDGVETQEFPIKSRNPVWNSELQSLASAAKTGFPVLLLGPSGAGKDVLANTIHMMSSRARAPIISVNCSALTETLVESELFGHVKGSFTGAINDRKGAFEAARGGTLFLDEIGDLPSSMQAKLLRAIENQEIRPIGSDRTITTDVRIIAATHQNLTSRIAENSFRSDLYYRLNVIRLQVPALSLRMEDFDDYLYSFAREFRVSFSHSSILKLRQHSWPGNIRELKNTVIRAAALFPKQRISEEHLQRLIEPDPNSSMAVRINSKNENVAGPSLNLPVIKEIERQMIMKRLEANRGNQRKTAQDLGIPKSTLHDRLKYYNIDTSAFRV